MADWMDELERLAELRDKGLLTDEEFEIKRQEIVNVPSKEETPEEEAPEVEEIVEETPEPPEVEEVVEETEDESFQNTTEEEEEPKPFSSMDTNPFSKSNSPSWIERQSKYNTGSTEETPEEEAPEVEEIVEETPEPPEVEEVVEETEDESYRNTTEEEEDDNELIESEISEGEIGDSINHVFISADGNEVICPPEMSEEDMGVALLTGNYEQELSDDPKKRVPGHGINEDAVVNQIRKIAMENLDNLENSPPNLRGLCEVMKKLPAGESRLFIVKGVFGDYLRKFAKTGLKSLTFPAVEYTQYGADFLFAIAFIKQIFNRQDEFLKELEGGTHALLDNATVLASALFPELGELEFEGKKYSSRELLYRVFWDLHLTMDVKNTDHRMMRWAVVSASIDHPRKWKKDKVVMFQMPIVAGGIKILWAGALEGIAMIITQKEKGLL